jgi:hypothetical protein
MASLLVAIDPGVNGGIVWSVNGDPVECAKMPGSDVEVCQLLADLSCKAKDAELFLEEPPLFAGKNIPGSAIGKLMWNTGVLYGAAVAMGWKIHRIRPAIWQKAHTCGTKGERSSTAVEEQAEGPRCRTVPDCRRHPLERRRPPDLRRRHPPRHQLTLSPHEERPETPRRLPHHRGLVIHRIT